MRLNLLHLLERAINVQRVELVQRNAICQEREFEVVDRGIAQRAGAGELLDVPELGPARRTWLRGIMFGMVPKDGRINPAGYDKFVGLDRLRMAIEVDDAHIKRLKQAKLLSALSV